MFFFVVVFLQWHIDMAENHLLEKHMKNTSYQWMEERWENVLFMTNSFVFSEKNFISRNLWCYDVIITIVL